MDFTNKNINLLTLHSGIWRFADNILTVFSAIYLLSLGISFPVVALVIVCSIIFRLLTRPLSLLLSNKIGLKKALILGVLIGSGLFLVLGKVSGFNYWLLFYGLYTALYDITYWLPYHSYYAIAGDEEKRGKQVGTQLGTVAIFQILAPIAGGLIITHLGYWPLYLSATIITLVSSIPLFFIKNISLGIPLNFKEAFKNIDKRGMLMMMGDGILYIHKFIWTIVLFNLVGNYVVFGGLKTFELLITTVMAVVLGYLLDKGKGKKIIVIGLLVSGIVIIARALWINTIPLIIISDVILALSYLFYLSSFYVGLYNMAKKSKNTLWFHFFGELGWDIGAIVALSTSALLFYLGVPLRFIMLFSLPGLFIVYYVLKRFYTVEKV